MIFPKLNNKGFASMALAMMLIVIPTATLVGMRFYSAMQKGAQLQKSTTTKQQFNGIKNWLITNALDADNDGFAELPKENAGNTLPLSMPMKSTDDYGGNIRYYTWDLGSANANPAYSQNNTAPPIAGLIGRIISAGKDGVYQTTAASLTPQGDDIVIDIYNTDVLNYQNNSGWKEDVVNHKVTQMNNTDQVAMGTQTPDGNAQVTIYNAISGVVASLGNVVNTIGSIAFKTGGVLTGLLNWNTNDTNTASGTAMMLKNLQGKLHLFDSTGTGLTISGGQVGVNNTTPAYPLDVKGNVNAGNGDWSGYYATANSATATLRISDATSYGQVLGFTGTDTNHPFAIRTNGNIVTFFDKNGNVGIGTSTPQVQFQTGNGNAYFGSTSDPTGGLYYNKTNGTIIGNYAASPWPGVNGLYVQNTIQSGGNIQAGGNIYWGTGGAWLSSYINQALLTTSAPTFAEVYTNDWFRNNLDGTGLYSTPNNMHWYAQNGYWNAASPSVNGYGGIRFRSDYNSTVRGYVYYDSASFGLLSNTGNWAYRISNGNQSDASYGAATISGEKNGYPGIAFRGVGGDYSGTIMMNGGSRGGAEGFYDDATGWRWYADAAGQTWGTGTGGAVKVGYGVQFPDGTVQQTAAQGLHAVVLTGTTTWNAPKTGTAYITLVGGGGGGGAGYNFGNSSGGGGGGTIYRYPIAVTAGTNYGVTIGGGGLGGVYGVSTTGGTGGNTVFNGGTLIAYGGAGGPQGGAGYSTGGGVNAGAPYGLNGGNGNAGTHDGGSSMYGGSVSCASIFATGGCSGMNSTLWGGGGSGAYHTYSGGNGYQGVCIIEY